MFRKREYRGSSHPVTLTDVRCIRDGAAIADGKWELRLVDPQAARTTYTGLCTLVLVGGADGWAIEAWRYTVDPDNGVKPPTTLKQPGFIGRGGQ